MSCDVHNETNKFVYMNQDGSVRGQCQNKIA
jgi:hypothetical protein